MRSLHILLCLWFLVLSEVCIAEDGAAGQDEQPPLPLTVWDIDFNMQKEGAIPAGLDKKALERLRDTADPKRLPMQTYSWLAYVTDTRRATVEKEALGLQDKPLVFAFTENEQPNYGPMMSFLVSSDLAQSAAVWRLELDVSRDTVGISGGIHLCGIAELEFHEDGLLKNNQVGIIRYAAGSPTHLSLVIDVCQKTVRVCAKNKLQPDGVNMSFPWRQETTRNFRELRLHGQLPGGHCEVPAKLAFDNICLTLEKRLPVGTP